MLRSIAAAAALASLGVALAAKAETALLSGPPGAEVEIEADRIVYTWDPLVMHLIGHVVARRGGGILRAASGTLDRKNGVLKLEGGVLGVQDRQVFLADQAVVDLNARSAELTKAVLFIKDRTPNPDAPRSGSNALTMHGSRVRQLAGGRYLAEDVRLTPCDCVGEPDYELLARTAEVGDDRARLRGVKLRLGGVTLPMFPVSLPLSGRASGLLAPQPGGAPSVGFSYSQPIFFTLGPSYDLTVSPGWYTGGHLHGTAPGDRSVKGPRLGLEGRYAPVEGTSGSLALDLYDDLDQHDSPGGRGFGGVRGVARLVHRTESSAGIFAAQGIAATDVMALRDPQPQSIETTYDLFTTDVGFWRARGPLTLGADATFIQDMRVEAVVDRKLFGNERRTTFQRLPAVFAQIAPVAMGPATLSLEASAVQFARFAGPDEQERLYGFAPTDLGAANAVAAGRTLATDGSRAPALRLDLSPRIAFAAPRTLPFELRLEAGGRVDGWIVEGYPDRDRTRAYAILDARAGFPLERRFGSALHRIEPALEVRALSKPLQSGGAPFGDVTDGGGPVFAARPDAAQQGLAATHDPNNPAADIFGVPEARRAYDEIDFAAPVTGAVQAVASLSQSLWNRQGRTAARFLRFDLLQDALLWASGAKARLGEASVVAGLQLGPFGAGASLRYDWKRAEVSALSAGANLRDARGDEVHASFGLLRASSSESIRAGIDELFSTARFAVPPSDLTGSANLGASGPLPLSLRLAYNAAYTVGPLPDNFANWTHTFTLTWDTPCHCAGLGLVLGFPFHDSRFLGSPTYSVRIDLKNLGSFTTF